MSMVLSMPRQWYWVSVISSTLGWVLSLKNYRNKSAHHDGILYFHVFTPNHHWSVCLSVYLSVGTSIAVCVGNYRINAKICTTLKTKSSFSSGNPLISLVWNGRISACSWVIMWTAKRILEQSGEGVICMVWLCELANHLGVSSREDG